MEIGSLFHGRRGARRVAGAFAVAMTAGSLAASATPALADTGSYTLTTWSQPSIGVVRILLDGATLSPPAGIPANATITTVDGSLQWDSQPFGDFYLASLCLGPFGSPDTSCFNFGPRSSSGWSITGDTDLAGSPAATTTMHLAAQVSDGSTSRTHAAVRPPLVLERRSITVNYTF